MLYIIDNINHHVGIPKQEIKHCEYESTTFFVLRFPDSNNIVIDKDKEKK